MSRAGYADFFPAAPSVLAEKKAQAERERTRQRSHREYERDPPNGAISSNSLVNNGSTSSSTVTSTQTLTKSSLPSHLAQSNNRSPALSTISPPVLPSPPIGTRHSLPPRPQVSLVQSYVPKEPPPLPPPPPALPTPKATPPAVKQDPAKRNWKLKYDPALEKKGDPKKSKDTIVRFDGEGISGPITDPRLAIPDYTKGPKIGKKRLRDLGLYRTRWKWDENYIGPGPPSQILISGLSPLTTENEISMHFRPYGDIQTLEVKVDPATGGSLGICSILYRDNTRTKSPAHEGAKKAVVAGNGATIGMQKVRVELDRDGLKGKKMAGRIVEEKRRKEYEAARSRPKPAPLLRDDNVRTNRAASPPRGRGASPSRSDSRITDRERDRDRDSRVQEPQKENYKALDHVGRWPYIFITARCIPGDQRYVRHLEGRLKNFGLKSVLCDRTGFYVVFWEKQNMEKCFRVCDGDRLFSYKMLMEMHPGGTRTPSPSRLPKVEAKPVDFLVQATTALMKEMKTALMTDFKKRIVAPTIYDSLESGRLHKRRKIEEAESKASVAIEVISPDNASPAVKDERATSVQIPLSLNSIVRSVSTTTKSVPAKPVKVALPRFKKRVVPKKEEPPKVNGLRKKPTKADARPLAHRLNQYDSEIGSDDESTATGDRPVSRGSLSRGLSTDIGDDDSLSATPLVTDHLGNLKRKRGSVGPTSKLRDTAMSTDDEGPAVEDRMDIKEEETAPKKPRLSDNDDSPFVNESAEDEVGGARSRAAKSKKSKKRSRDIDFTSSESEGEDGIVVAKPVERTKRRHGSPASRRLPVDDEDEIVNVADDYDDMNDSIALKSALKTGKELGESRARVKAVVAPVEVPKALLLARQLAVDDDETDEDIPKEVVDVSWGVSTAQGPIATVEDDEDMVLDLDGWQTLVKDEEDFEFLKLALADVEPAKLGNVAAWAFKQKEIKAANREGMKGATRTQEKIEGFYRPNPSGCARTEGYRKIPESEKSMYLPHRLQVAAKRAAMNQPPSPSAPTTTATKSAGSTSRSNRVNNRRLVAELQNQKQMLSSDADVMRFNQLKKRKKPVKFARSAIHNWGLYAMENISANDMIIEYVGEIVRQQVADMREIKYLKSGIGSSYLFRIDDTTVIDATKRGGIARFINHSCTPNCTAKIIKVEGSKRIVIYALRDIKENEELTYDYKFERELGSDDRIPCLCGSSGCKGFLN